MSKWNMIIDVAECTNCQLCTLSAMDEYVDNHWRGYAAAMPRPCRRAGMGLGIGLGTMCKHDHAVLLLHTGRSPTTSLRLSHWLGPLFWFRLAPFCSSRPGSILGTGLAACLAPAGPPPVHLEPRRPGALRGEHLPI